jgi:hypothetical protein
VLFTFYAESVKFTIIQDVHTNPKFYKKVVELWNYEKEKKDILSKIESDKSLYKKIKPTTLLLCLNEGEMEIEEEEDENVHAEFKHNKNNIYLVQLN